VESPQKDLADRTAIVTGASSTIGAATARRLAAGGACVGLASLPCATGRLDALVAEIQDAGGQAFPLPADLGTRAQARALVHRVVETWGHLDILVVADDDAMAAGGVPANGAGARPCLGQAHPAVRGLLHLATAALPMMTRQGRGDIVTLAPVAGHVLRVGAGGLASARIALEVAALCDSLRRQAGERGIRVAVIEPDIPAPWQDAPGQGSTAAEDVADAIVYVLTQPPRVSIAELLIWPTHQPA